MGNYYGCHVQFLHSSLVDIPEIQEALDIFTDCYDSHNFVVINGIVNIRMEEIKWGRPSELLDALMKNEQPYDLQTDTYYEYTGEEERYRPGYPVHTRSLDVNGLPYIGLSEVQRFIKEYENEPIKLAQELKTLTERLDPDYIEPIEMIARSWEGDLVNPDVTQHLATGKMHMKALRTYSHKPETCMYQHESIDGHKGRIYATKLIWINDYEATFFDFAEKQFFYKRVNTSVK